MSKPQHSKTSPTTLFQFRYTKEQAATTLPALRKQAGLSQAELAKRVKVTQPYVAMLEAGGKTNPSLATTQRLAKALKVKVGELLK